MSAQSCVEPAALPTVYVLSFERPAMLDRCVASYAADGITPFVMENGSKNIPPEYWSDKTVFHFDRPVSFSEAYNWAFDRAFKNGERRIVASNHDVYVEHGAIAAMDRLMDTHPNIGVVGARLTFPDGSLQHAGIGIVGPPHNHYMELRHPAFDRTGPVLAVTAALAMYRVVPGVRFDTGYYYCWEDIDLCRRYQEAGYQVWYCAEARAVHECGSVRFSKGWAPDKNREKAAGDQRIRTFITGHLAAAARTGHVISRCNQAGRP